MAATHVLDRCQKVAAPTLTPKFTVSDCGKPQLLLEANDFPDRFIFNLTQAIGADLSSILLISCFLQLFRS